jgi:hypothetical protein
VTLQLRDSPCRTFNSDIRLHIPATGLYTYADAVAICGEPELLGEENLLNSVVTVEVLSPSNAKL